MGWNEDLLEPVREAAAEARLGGWGEHPVPESVPDPAVRPVVDVEAVRAELAGRALWWDSKCQRWQKVDVSPEAQEAALRDYVSELQDRADAHWRQTGAYRLATEQALAQAAEASADRRYEKTRAERRVVAADKRFMELFEYGLSPRQAREQVRREFPEEG